MPEDRLAREAIYSDCQQSADASGIAALEPLRGSHVFVSGATGFVGTWLLATIAFLNDNFGFRTQVTALSRRPSRLAQNLLFLTVREDIRQVQADVRQFVDVPSDVSWIVHAAGVPDSREHASNPIEVASVIAEGTTRMLRMAEQADRLRSFLHFSSGLVHSRSELRPRGGGGVGVASVYKESKAFSEALCAAFRTQGRLPVVITRPFTFLGPFQSLDAPWAANNFLHAAIKRQPLKLLGSGEISRSYLYGSDMAMIALHQLIRGKSGTTYDLGGIEAIPLIELAKTVAEQAGGGLEIRVNTGGREVVSTPLVPDMTPSMSGLGVRPAFTLDQTVRRTLDWYRGANAPKN